MFHYFPDSILKNQKKWEKVKGNNQCENGTNEREYICGYGHVLWWTADIVYIRVRDWENQPESACDEEGDPLPG